MSAETSPRLMRNRLVETIVPLAASAGQLVDYVHADGSDINGAISDFVDWTYESVPGLIEAGLLPDDLTSALLQLRRQALTAAQSAPREECGDSGAPPLAVHLTEDRQHHPRPIPGAGHPGPVHRLRTAP